MYHWVTDKEYLGRVKSCCADVINRLVQVINAEGRMEVKQHLVGSGAKNLILQNANEPIDLDYNLEILDFGEFRKNDCRAIKEYVMRIFNEILEEDSWGDCDDSTSALTTKLQQFRKGNRTEFKIDVGITYVASDGRWQRMIHEKTGVVQLDRYFWNEAPMSRGLEKRVEWLKDNDLWVETREKYLEMKNRYLSRGDRNHPSFIIYIEAVNEVWGKYAR